MKFDYSKRVITGIILLFLFAIFTNSKFLIQAVKRMSKDIGSDWISSHEQRYAELRKLLPSRGVIGYVTDKKPEEIFYSFRTLKEYYLTQYALSPVIVVNSQEPKIIVSNFTASSSMAKFLNDRRFMLLKNFGDGVALFERRSK